MTGQSQVTVPGLASVQWGTETDLDENAYGAAAVALCRDIPKLHHQIVDGRPSSERCLTITRLFISLLVLAVNLVFQLTILWYIYKFVVMPSVRNVQQLYADYRAHNYAKDGSFDDDAWAIYPDKQAVCEITMSSPPFFFGILVLWSLLMMDEWRRCQKAVQDIWAIRHVDFCKEMVVYPKSGAFDGEGQCLVVGLTPAVRWANLLIVCFPRIFIALVLYFLGCQWLASAASFSDMTLNAMALQFVKDIDEILYVSCLPLQLQKAIADTNVFKIEKKMTKKDLDGAEWRGYRDSLFWIVSTATMLVMYSCVVQNVLPFDLRELNSLCEGQRVQSSTPVCTLMTYLGSTGCYPYGMSPIEV